jgi:hypothetical protein
MRVSVGGTSANLPNYYLTCFLVEQFSSRKCGVPCGESGLSLIGSTIGLVGARAEPPGTVLQLSARSCKDLQEYHLQAAQKPYSHYRAGFIPIGDPERRTIALPQELSFNASARTRAI